MIGTDRHTRTLDIYLARSPKRKIYRRFSQKCLKPLFVPSPPSVPFPTSSPKYIVLHCRRKMEEKKDSERYGSLTIDHDEQHVAKKEPVFLDGVRGRG